MIRCKRPHALLLSAAILIVLIVPLFINSFALADDKIVSTAPTSAPAQVRATLGFEARFRLGVVPFNNRSQYQVDHIPDLLDGKAFVYSAISSANTITVTEPGVVYLLLKAEQITTYENIGFTHVDTIAPFKLASNFADNAVVMMRDYTIEEVKEGIAFTVNPNAVAAEWVIVFANLKETFAFQESAVIKGGANNALLPLGKGQKIDAARAHVFAELPSFMEDFSFTQSNNWTNSVTSMTAGNVYAFYFSDATKDSLISQGFTIVEDANPLRLTTTFTPDTYCGKIMVKSCEVGESFSISEFGGIFMGLSEQKANDPRDAALQAPHVYTMSTDSGKAEIEANYADGTRKWQGIPGIEYAKGGRLWSTWYSGGDGEDFNNYVILVTSGDGGKTWSDAKVIIDPDKDGPVRAFDSVLWSDPNGRMWIFWAQEYTLTTGWSYLDGRHGVWAMYTDNPDQENPAWSEPTRLCDGVMMNKPLVTSDGKWLLPSYMIINRQNDITSQVGPSLYLFEGYNEPWPIWSNIGQDAYPNPDTFCEHMAVENENGDIRVIIRTTSGIQEVTTSDEGQTWSSAKIMRDEANGKQMSAVNSRPFITTLASGNKLLLYNDVQSDSRTNMTVALSTDDGKSWPYKLLLDSRNVVTYPDMAQGDDGMLYITYDRTRYNDMEILLSCIREEDIIAGELVSEDGFLKKIINNNGLQIIEEGAYDMQGDEDILTPFAGLLVKDGVSALKTFEVGAKLFSDRNYTVFRYPSCFEDAIFIQGRLNSGSGANPVTTVSAVKAGYVYIMTPGKGQNLSQQEALEAEGFLTLNNIPLQRSIFSNQAETFTVMRKYLNENESVSLKMYGIIIGADGMQDIERFNELASGLPATTAVSLSDKVMIQGVRNTYNALSGSQKELVSSDLVNRLLALESIIAEMEKPDSSDSTSSFQDTSSSTSGSNESAASSSHFSEAVSSKTGTDSSPDTGEIPVVQSLTFLAVFSIACLISVRKKRYI